MPAEGGREAVPTKYTVDESGFVVLVQSLPERDIPRLEPKRGTGKKSITKATTSKKPKAQPKKRKSTTPSRPISPAGSTKPPANLVACLVCNASVRKERMDGHLRKAHPNVKPSSSRPQPQQLKPKIAFSSTNAPMILCSVCDAHVREDGWTKHVEKVHSPKRWVVSEPQKPAQRSTKKAAKRKKTPEQIREEIRGIERDLKKLMPGFHRVRMEELRRRRALLLKELQGGRALPGPTPTGRTSGGAGRSLRDLEPHQQEVLRQSRGDEGSYGDKYLGQVRRDYNGSFGSIPLYDDYGEESFPD